jgi:hypothetical protein
MNSAMLSGLSANQPNDASKGVVGGNLTVMDMIDRTFRIYRRGVIPFLAVTAVVLLPIAIIQIPLSIQQQRQPNSDATVVLSLLTIIVSLVSTIIQTLIAQPVLTVYASELHFGNKITLREAFDRVRQRIGQVAMAYLLYTIFLGVAFFVSALLTLCFVGVVGFIVAGYFAIAVGFFLVPVLVLEDVSSMDALNRAWHLGKQRFWRGLSLSTLIGLISFTIVISFGLVLGLIVLPLQNAGYDEALLVAQNSGQTLLSIFTTPLGLIVLVVFYYDTRVRLEALDVSFYLSKHTAPRANQVPSPKPSGGLIDGRDVVNMLILVVLIAGIFGGFALLIYGVFAAFGL